MNFLLNSAIDEGLFIESNKKVVIFVKGEAHILNIFESTRICIPLDTK